MIKVEVSRSYIIELTDKQGDMLLDILDCAIDPDGLVFGEAKKFAEELANYMREGE